MRARYRRAAAPGAGERARSRHGEGRRDTQQPRVTPRRREPRERRASLRLALAIASRTSLRALGRSALIAVMVAIPVAGMVGVGVVFESSTPTTEDRLTTELGQAEARLQLANPGTPVKQHPMHPNSWSGGGADVNYKLDVTDLLPRGTRVLEQFETTVLAETASGVARFGAIEGPSWDQAHEGRFSIIGGRIPQNDREVMVTEAVLPRLGATIGDTVQILSPDPMAVTIVGVIDAAIWPDSEEHFFGRTGAFQHDRTGTMNWRTSYFLPDLSLDWDSVQQLNTNGVTALSRAVLNNPPPAGTYFAGANNASNGIVEAGIIIGGFAAFEVILLAGAAFTVTARQQQRSLATISSVGAGRKMLFRILTANGIVLGAVGGLIGTALGALGAAVFIGLSATGSSTQYYGFYVPWWWILGVVAFAILIGWIASLAPARAAARFDIVAALRGSRKPPTASRRRPAIGIGLLGVGVAITVVGGVLLAVVIGSDINPGTGHPSFWLPIAALVAGPILAQVGLILCGPLALRAIAATLARRGIGARLASRDAARNPSRAVPTLASIMTTVFVAAFGMCMLASGEQNTINNHQHQVALGQVVVPLSYVNYEDYVTHQVEPDPVVRALRTNLDIDELRALTSVPDPVWGEPATSAREEVSPFAMPIVPVANLCPRWLLSPEYGIAVETPGTPEYEALADDWRCAQNYPDYSTNLGAHLLVGDATDLALILDRAPSAEAMQTLAAGGAVAFYPEYVHEGTFSIGLFSTEQEAADFVWDKDTSTAESLTTLDAVVELPEHPLHFGVIVSQETADRLGLNYQDSLVLASLSSEATQGQLDALRQEIMVLPGNSRGDIYSHLEKGPVERASPVMWGIVGLTALIAIAAAAVAIGLARFDGRQDDATLSALGARSLVRRSFAFWQALILVGAGTLVGTAVALVPSIALSANPGMPLSIPWPQLGTMMVGLPLVIACGSWLLAGRSTPLARRLSIA